MTALGQPASRPRPPAEYDHEHTWAICRLAETFVARWDRVFAGLAQAPPPEPERRAPREIKRYGAHQ
jgi:hypothetical protein